MKKNNLNLFENILNLIPKILDHHNTKSPVYIFLDDQIKKFIKEIKSEYNLNNSDICLSGFSQGCMISLNVGLTLQESLSCIVGFSGKIIDKNDLSKRILSKTDILLIHGELDTVVTPSNLLEAKDFFIRNKINIDTKIIKNCDHSIPAEASSCALSFIKEHL